MEFHKTLEDFKAEVGGMVRDAFIRKHTVAFLVIDTGGVREATREFLTFVATSTEKRPTQRIRRTGGPSEILVAPLTKSDRNVFHNMITLGRAATNDVVVPHPSVSKFHAFFRKDPETGLPTVWDAGSKYGTKIKGGLLSQGQGAPLKSGDNFYLADMTKVTYFEPGDFFDYLDLSKRLGGDQLH
ncbi:MAG: FHA domain-containing protein [Planctomycetota bacterium]|jgi:hypothetical protein